MVCLNSEYLKLSRATKMSASFNNFGKQNTSIDTTWVGELAKNEINPDAANMFNTLSQLDPRQIIEESSIELLENIRDLFNDYARAFNIYSENNTRYNEAKVYGITNTPADFMLFRNNLKLVFANTAHGIINISFSQHAQTMGVDSAAGSQGNTQSKDLIAQTGAFMDVIWTFQGEKINLEKLAKFYFVEFIKASRIVKKDSNNQLLLKQIKALLQEKGIDI